MKHVVKAISLTCDGCGQTFETLDGMTCHADDEDGKLVEETARNSDWKMMNGHHYCPRIMANDRKTAQKIYARRHPETKKKRRS